MQNPPQTGFAPIAHGRLYYEISGQGLPVVLIHGNTLDLRMWPDRMISELSRRFQVITYDLRGFGKSSLPAAPYSHKADLLQLFDYLGIDRASLVGFSLGGHTAIEFAISYPLRINRLSLVSSAVNGFSWSVKWDFRARELGIDQAKKVWLDHELFASVRGKKQIEQLLSLMVGQYSAWHWVNKDLKERNPLSSVNRLREITAPTQVLVGQLDLPDFGAIASLLSRNIFGAQLQVLPGVGHMIPLENQNLFLEKLLPFLQHAETN